MKHVGKENIQQWREVSAVAEKLFFGVVKEGVENKSKKKIRLSTQQINGLLMTWEDRTRDLTLEGGGISRAKSLSGYKGELRP